MQYFFVMISCIIIKQLIIKPSLLNSKLQSQFIQHLYNKMSAMGKYLVPKNSNKFSKTTFITNFSVMLRSSLVHSFVDFNQGLKLSTQLSLVMMLSQIHVAPCSAGVQLWRILQPGELENYQTLKRNPYARTQDIKQSHLYYSKIE